MHYVGVGVFGIYVECLINTLVRFGKKTVLAHHSRSYEEWPNAVGHGHRVYGCVFVISNKTRCLNEAVERIPFIRFRRGTMLSD